MPIEDILQRIESEKGWYITVALDLNSRVEFPYSSRMPDWSELYYLEQDMNMLKPRYQSEKLCPSVEFRGFVLAMYQEIAQGIPTSEAFTHQWTEWYGEPMDRDSAVALEETANELDRFEATEQKDRRQLYAEAEISMRFGDTYPLYKSLKESEKLDDVYSQRLLLANFIGVYRAFRGDDIPERGLIGDMIGFVTEVSTLDPKIESTLKEAGITPKKDESKKDYVGYMTRIIQTHAAFIEQFIVN